MPFKKGKPKLLYSRLRKHKKNRRDLINELRKTNEHCVELNWTVPSDSGTRCNKTCGFDCCHEESGPVGISVMEMTSKKRDKEQLSIGQAERGVINEEIGVVKEAIGVVKEEICNQRPVAIVLPTRHQSITFTVMNSQEVGESIIAGSGKSIVDESNVVNVDESTVHNFDDNTVVKTAEGDYLCAADGLSDLQHNLESQCNSEFEDTFVKVLDWANIISSRSLENNVPYAPSLQERDNTAFEESDFNYCSSFSTARAETETDNVRIVSRNDNYFENQKSRNANKKEAVTGIQMFGQTNAQHKDVQDSRLVHEDNIQFPQESGHSPHSVPVATPNEGRNTSHQDQMFTQLHDDVNHFNMHDVPDSPIINTTVSKLVEKVDHLESMIDRLSRLFLLSSRLVLLSLRSNSRIPDSMKKQDLVISKCQKNREACFNDDDIISQETFPADNFIHSECLAFDLVQYDRRQVSPPTCFPILAEAMNSTRSASMGQGDAEKTEKMQNVSKDLKICEPANQPMAMSMVNRPLWDTGPESDEIGHTLSLQMNQSEENLEHNCDLQQNLEGQAEISFKAGRNCSLPEEMITVEKDNAENHGFDSLKGSEEMNLIEDKSRCLSDAILTQSINMGHTNKASLENSEKDEQLDKATKSTKSCVRAVDGLACSRKDYTDTGAIPMVDNKPTFINSDADVPCGRDSVIVWNKPNLETVETSLSTSKFSVEAAHLCSSTNTMDEGCLNQKESVMGLSSSILKVKEIDCCQNVDAMNLSCDGHMVSNINVCTVKMDPSEFSPEADPVVSDPEHITGPGIPAQHEESQQSQVSISYSYDQVMDATVEEFTPKSQSIQDCDPKKQRENKFISGGKVQEMKLKEMRYVLNKRKSSQRFKAGVRCRHCSLHKRRGNKGNVKLKKNMESARRVSHVENFPQILSDIKLLHYNTIIFPQGTAPSATLMNQTIMGTKKTDFAAELGISVSKKNNSSQESLIDDFLMSLVSPWFIFPTISSGKQRVILLPTGLQLYFERLMRGTPPEERERMSYEWLRLQTFINYPSSAPGSGIRLARAGFYYSGNGTVTVCYACGGQHSGWNFHDDPYEIHRRISPDCPFLRGNPTYPNIPIMQEEEQNGIQLGSNTSGTPLSQTGNLTMVNQQCNSNRSSEMSAPSAIGSQNSTITEVEAQSSDLASISIQNPQERGLEEQASQQTMSEDEHSLGIDQHVTLTEAALDPNTSGESQQQQSRTTEDITLQSLVAENTQCRNPEVHGLVEPIVQVDDSGVHPTPQTISESPRHPEYAPLSSRVNSYTGWPARLDQTPQQMAEAGFYYAGINDYTRCFQCGGGLRNWEPGDNPWIEHARWYPQCAYVLGKRGQKFVNAVLKKQAELLAAQNAERNIRNSTTTSGTTTTTVTTTTDGTTTTTVTTMTSGTTTTTVTTTTSMSSGAISKTCNEPVLEPATLTGQLRCFQNSNENEIANKLMNEMGYQRERIREAILEVKRRRGQQEIAVEHVLEILIADEERKARAGRQNEATTVEELIQESGRLTVRDTYSPHALLTPTGSMSADVPSSSSAFSNQEQCPSNNLAASNRPPSPPLLELTNPQAIDADSPREENIRLRDQNKCKLCMDRNVELAFVPCGHLVCCEVCGQMLRFCPICRAKIQASLKIYLS